MNPQQNGTPAKIEFDINVPQVLALAYPTGKPCQSRFSGDQLMFTCTNGARFYVEPYVQDRIIAAGIQVGTPFEIVKRETRAGNRRVVDYQVRNLSGAAVLATTPVSADKSSQHYNEQIHPTTPAPPVRPIPQPFPLPNPHPNVQQTAATSAAVQPQGPMNGAGEDAAAIMARCYRAAVDVALDAVTYAEGKGLRITPDFEDIRAMAATLVITETGGRR